MKLKFLGATGTVTGSKYLVAHRGRQFLIDCGLFQGPRNLRQRNWEDLPVDAAGIEAIILTHAHIDHSGYIPRLIKQGFRGKILCTSATRDLCKILLPDCGHLMEEEANYANRRKFSKHHPALPLFSFDEAVASLNSFQGVPFNQAFPLGEGLSLRFRRAGHILGASNVTLSDEAASLCFSGDIGREEDPILPPPEVPVEANHLVMESTYGNRTHEKSDPLEDLAAIIDRTFKRGGTLIVPAFAVGRAQQLLYYVSRLLREDRIPELPVYLNSPMAINVTGLYCDHRDDHHLSPSDCREMCNIATYVNDPRASRRLNESDEPKLIISASGMATGGRVLHSIKRFGPDERNTLLFTGFQAAGTRGEKIVHGAETVKIHGEEIPIRSEVLNMNNLSAHADREELLGWVGRFPHKPERVFITHGEPSGSAALKEALDQRGFSAEIPDYLAEYEL